MSEVVLLWQTPISPLLTAPSLSQPNRVHIEDESAAETLALSLHEHLTLVAPPGTPPVIVCVGTDRSTGDSLGPLTGSALQERRLPVPIYGTLEEPVHAANLTETLEIIKADRPGQPILAVDACLGRAENVGFVSVKPGALRPGSGVNKRLPSVGHLHVVGVVNVGGFMEYLVLQNTRLSLVMRMAALITDGIERCLRQLWLPESSYDGGNTESRRRREKLALPVRN